MTEPRIMLRCTASGKLESHHFLNAEHAKDWLKTDTKNNERYTVCFVTHATAGPEGMDGHFQQIIPTVSREIMVNDFIDEVMDNGP